MNKRPLTVILLVLTLAVVAYSIPASLADAYHRGGFYLFSREFLEDIPKRFTGAGHIRFIVQPTVATILGILNGLADVRAGRPPYLYGVLFHRGQRRPLLMSGFASIVNLILLGILLDSVFQWVLYGVSHPGAALVVGPTLVIAPYSIVRALTNRLARLLQ